MVPLETADGAVGYITHVTPPCVYFTSRGGYGLLTLKLSGRIQEILNMHSFMDSFLDGYLVLGVCLRGMLANSLWDF